MKIESKIKRSRTIIALSIILVFVAAIVAFVIIRLGKDGDSSSIGTNQGGDNGNIVLVFNGDESSGVDKDNFSVVMNEDNTKFRIDCPVLFNNSNYDAIKNSSNEELFYFVSGQSGEDKFYLSSSSNPVWYDASSDKVELTPVYLTPNYDGVTFTGTTDVIVSHEVTNISSTMFRENDEVTNVTLPITTTTISENAFRDCVNLESVSLSGDLDVENYAFFGCESLNEVNVLDLGSFLNTTFSNNYSNPLAYGACLFVSGELASELVISDDLVTSVNDYAFYGAGGIESVTIRGNISSVGTEAFFNCLDLTSLQIEDSSNLQTIGTRAFYNCTSLDNVSLNSSLKTLSMYAFSNCTALTSFTFGETPSVEEIGNNCFAYCTSLTSIVIPASVETMGMYVFLDCADITIYCESATNPAGWNSMWSYNSGEVVWNYTGE